MTDAQPLKLSRLAYGFWRLNDWNIDTRGILDRIHHCLDLGITTLDHADIYGGYTVEEQFGSALRREPSLREKVQLVTKCGIIMPAEARPEFTYHYYDTSREHIVASANRSLKLLGTDYLDLLLIHRPDPLMDPDEIAGAFDELYQAGKVRHFGVSNFTPSQVAMLRGSMDLPLEVNQVQCSVTHMDPLHDGTLDQCRQLDILPMAWSPFGGGELFSGDGARVQRLRVELEKVANETDAGGIDQVALAWLLKHPAQMVPVIGTGRIERITSAAAALDLELSREQWFRIWTASAGHEVA